MESGAADCIHYTDADYAACGVEIGGRAKALGCDIVVYLPTPTASDAALLKAGALLFTNMNLDNSAVPALRALLQRHAICIRLDNIADHRGRRPFADILSEVGGCAAITAAAAMLADSVGGKGILMGGVAGIVPCEVLVTGSSIAAIAAARTALGLGATVRMFDNDTYSLRHASGQLGHGVAGSTFHPRVFENALRSADIIVATATDHAPAIDADLTAMLKRGAICFDLTGGKTFTALQAVPLNYNWQSMPRQPQQRLCITDCAMAVPRTVAMAMSNAFAALFDDIAVCDGAITNALRLNCCLRTGALTFLGKCVNARAAALLGVRTVDINLFLQFS
jgi:alanine dehydrogenase